MSHIMDNKVVTLVHIEGEDMTMQLHNTTQNNMQWDRGAISDKRKEAKRPFIESTYTNNWANVVNG